VMFVLVVRKMVMLVESAILISVEVSLVYKTCDIVLNV
jgi:hypothetical protein